ncbi:hypothetical protein CRUP_006644 [Coryphaenoides rupestris]|nr:hypothetical protein CRUP_006644 [Coryphaenoides rupestris]
MLFPPPPPLGLTISSCSSKSSLSTTFMSGFSFSFSLLPSLAGSTSRSLILNTLFYNTRFSKRFPPFFVLTIATLVSRIWLVGVKIDMLLIAVDKTESSAPGADPVVQVSAVKIFYGSQTGTAQGFSKELAEDVRSLGIPAEVINMKDYDPDDRLAEECSNRSVCTFLLATYTDGQPTENAHWFCKWLEEASTDFRYGKTYLRGLRYAVFGLGHSAYVGHYNTVSKNVDKWLWMLNGARLLTRGQGDCNVVQSRGGSVQADFLAWKVHFLSRLRALVDRGEVKGRGGGGSSCKSHAGSCEKSQTKDAQERGGGRGAGGEDVEVSQHNSAEEEEEEEEEMLLESSSDEESAGPGETKSLVDVEDLGHIVSALRGAKVRSHPGVMDH